MTGFIVAFDAIANRFTAVCEKCGDAVETECTEWPELDRAMRDRQTFDRFGWAWANLGPNLANHARRHR